MLQTPHGQLVFGYEFNLEWDNLIVSLLSMSVAFHLVRVLTPIEYVHSFRTAAIDLERDRLWISTDTTSTKALGTLGQFHRRFGKGTHIKSRGSRKQDDRGHKGFEREV